MAQKRNQKYQDPVVGLITGRMVTRTDAEGKNIQVFKPFKINPNPTLHLLRKVKGHKFSEDQILTHERLRLMPSTINHEEFHKSDAEKAELKKRKKEHNTILRKAGLNPQTRLNVSLPMSLGSLRELRAL